MLNHIWFGWWGEHVWQLGLMIYENREKGHSNKSTSLYGFASLVFWDDYFYNIIKKIEISNCERDEGVQHEKAYTSIISHYNLHCKKWKEKGVISPYLSLSVGMSVCLSVSVS